MNDLYLLIVLAPLLVAPAAKLVFGHEVNKQEMIVGALMTILVVAAVWHLGRAAKAWDLQILNGAVTAKQQERVPCSHSYECFCKTDSKGNRSCQTCHEHAYDWDWVVRSTIGSFTIARVDRRGSDEPKRYTSVMIGDPVSQTDYYNNWIKAADSSLFAASPVLAAQYQGKLPAYPNHIYDYYNVDRFIADGIDVADARDWNRDIALTLRELGPKRQANLIVVVSKDPSPSYADALRAQWRGGAKNDVIVTIGAPDYPKIAWARSTSWSKNDLVNILIRDRLQALGTLDRAAAIDIITDEIATHFERRSMKEFEYLKEEIEPGLGTVIVAAALGVLGTIGAMFFFARVDFDPLGTIFKTNKPR